MTLSLSSVHDHLSRHHASSINDRARFDISSARAHACPPSKTGNRQLGPRPAASPLASQPYDPIRAVPVAGLRFCLTGNSTRPQPRPHRSSQFITDKNMCDDVSVNKSLYGNERETPSIRSQVTRIPARSPASSVRTAAVTRYAPGRRRRGRAPVTRCHDRAAHGGCRPRRLLIVTTGHSGPLGLVG